jgi:alpha-L-fucosidase
MTPPRPSALALALALATVPPAAAAPASADRPEAAQGLGNRPDRLERFRDLGFGLFIHWSVDSQIGSDISHSLVGSSDDYRRRFFQDLPRTFNPRKFHPEDWASLARLAGVKYVVLTTKHHSGFALWHTRTTDFGVEHTPFRRDIVGEVARAFRAQGIAVGFYFSPEDFHWLETHGKPVARRPHPGVTPQENRGLLDLDRAQLGELATRYGPVDVWFLDGPAAGMRDVIWRAQPGAVITRDVIETPEQTIPGVPLDRAWESCLTMGTAWQYKPAHESYRSGGDLIQILIETRAKGGNLLLNVGPKPDGELPIEQEERLRQMALWHFAYGEAIHDVRPWIVTNEGNVWFTRKKNQDTVYAFLKQTQPWSMGERKKFTLRSVRARSDTTVRVLGSSSAILEYHPDADPRPRFSQDAAGLHLDVMMAQRLHNDRKWYDPVVLELSHVEPALQLPRVVTAGASAGTFEGELQSLGDAPRVEVGFQYRRAKVVEELLDKEAPWQDTTLVARTAPGRFSTEVKGLTPGVAYQYRAVVKHPVLTLYGEEKTVGARPLAP